MKYVSLKMKQDQSFLTFLSNSKLSERGTDRELRMEVSITTEFRVECTTRALLPVAVFMGYDISWTNLN